MFPFFEGDICTENGVKFVGAEARFLWQVQWLWRGELENSNRKL
jgi:hypothetical protein